MQLNIQTTLVLLALIIAAISIFVQRHPMIQIAVILIAVALLFAGH